jgi:hypothetical protein
VPLIIIIILSLLKSVLPINAVGRH